MVELSVILTISGPTPTLGASIQALVAQTEARGNYEIILVDYSVGGIPAPLPSLPVIRQVGGGPAAAMNRGIARAIGAYCLFLTHDLIATPALVAEHLRAQHAAVGALCFGPVKDRLPHRSSRSAQLATHDAAPDRATRVPTFIDCDARNISIPHAALTAAGGFAVDMPEGHAEELAYRLAARGLSIIRIPSAYCHRVARRTLHRELAAAERAGRAQLALYRRHPASLPLMELGTYGEMPRRVQLVHRLLQTLGYPRHLLIAVSPLVARSRWGDQWMRFLVGYCWWRGVRRALAEEPDLWRRLTRGTIILTYHAIGYPGERHSRYVVPVRRFARQMAWLAHRGYHVLALDAYLADRAAHRLPPAPSVVVTFDDGYADNATLAAPILRRHGFPATVFLVSRHIGGANCWDDIGDLASRALIGERAIRATPPETITYGAHTRSHRSLPDIPTACLRDEIEGSRSDLETLLGRPVRCFAYPYGRFDAASVEAVRAAGFAGACTIRRGINSPATPPHLLRRATIHGSDSLLRFVLALRFGYTHLR